MGQLRPQRPRPAPPLLLRGPDRGQGTRSQGPPTPAPPLRAQSGNCPCWGHLVALARFPFVPRAGSAFEEVTPRFVSSPASCPCPASSILPAGSFGIRLRAATRPELGGRGCIHLSARTQTDPPAYTHILSPRLNMHIRMHSHMLASFGIPQAPTPVCGIDPSCGDWGHVQGRPSKRCPPHPSTLSQLPHPLRPPSERAPSLP